MKPSEYGTHYIECIDEPDTVLDCCEDDPGQIGIGIIENGSIQAGVTLDVERVELLRDYLDSWLERQGE